jgi:DNA-binding MarR family transcriptional regulator
MEINKPFDPATLHHNGDEPHLLREIVRTHQALMTGFSRGVGMPASRLALMRALVNALPDDIGIMELARKLGINAAAVTRQLKEMESQDLILRRFDGRDGRRNYVKLSDKGLNLFKTIHDRSHELERSLTLFINHEEMVHAVNVLIKVRHFIEGFR